MVLLELALFLIVAAIVIKYIETESKTQIWLWSITVPLTLVIWILLLYRISDYAHMPICRVLFADALGMSLISVIVSFLTIFFCLRKKLAVGKEYRIPAKLIYAIIGSAILGLISVWGYYFAR